VPYTTVVAGTTITASWSNANNRDQAVTPFASAAARASAITSPVDGMLCRLTDTDVLQTYNGTAWVTITDVSAIIATSETGTGTSFTDLATPGPAVTLETGTKALVTVSCGLKNSAANFTLMAFAVSGATTRAAASTEQLGSVDTNFMYASRTSYVTGLTAGSNTFTAKYAVTAGTGTWIDRNITVVGIP
jgi:hypothetical protein